MDSTESTFHGLAFARRFLESNGDAFQEFFACIMELRYPDDFVRVRAGGPDGDLKCDGLRGSGAIIYQVYGPLDWSNNRTIQNGVDKVEADFLGALEHWGDTMEQWVFVHNARGLPARVAQKLVALQADYPDIRIGQMAFAELRSAALSLSESDLIELFGPTPTNRTIARLGHEELRPILQELEWVRPIPDADLRPPPADKLDKNRLNEDVQAALQLGMRRVELLDDYFARHPKATLGDQVAATMNQEYRRIREQGLGPDAVFFELERFVGGPDRSTPSRQAAVLAVLAYYFEQCDIFERVVPA